MPGIWVVGAPQLQRIQNPPNPFCQATPPTPPTHHYLGSAIVGILSFPFSFSLALDSRNKYGITLQQSQQISHCYYSNRIQLNTRTVMECGLEPWFHPPPWILPTAPAFGWVQACSGDPAPQLQKVQTRCSPSSSFLFSLPCNST